jgi:uncharacterized membrane protein
MFQKLKNELGLRLNKKTLPVRGWTGLAGVIFCLILIVTSDMYISGPQETTVFSVQRARVISVEDDRLTQDPQVEGLYIGKQTIEIELIGGDHAGRHVRLDNTLSRFFNHRAEENMTMLMAIVTDDAGEIVHVDVFGHARDGFILGFIGLFFLILILVARKKGIYSVMSLMFTLITIIYLMIPAILAGHSPVLFAVITAILTGTFSIVMISDFSLKSLGAIGGTLIGVIIAGGISVIAGHIANISGMHISDAEEVLFQSGSVPVRVPELLFAGIIIATLGAVVDVGMSIASAVFEIKDVNPNLTVKELYKSGMNIGRDIVGTMSNTLILAFAGSSISVLIIIVAYRLPALRLINLDILAVEVIQGISASIGLVLAVPVTALLAAVLASDNKVTAFLTGKMKMVQK